MFTSSRTADQCNSPILTDTSVPLKEVATLSNLSPRISPTHLSWYCWGRVLLGLVIGLLCIGQHGEALAGNDTTEIRFRHFLGGEFSAGEKNINAVTTIVQDPVGYLWFGGENGLARYDGIAFEIFQKDTLKPNSLSGNYIWDAVFDQQGVMWVATSQGLNRYDAKNHNFTNFNGLTNDDGTGLPATLLFSLAVGQDNSLYIGSDKGLFRFNPQRTHFEQIEALGKQTVRDLYADSDGTLWVGTSEHGLYRYDPQFDTFQHWQHDRDNPRSLPHNYVRAIERDQFGGLWVGTLGGGVARMDENQRNFSIFQHLTSDPGSISSDNIWDIHKDREGNLWIATDPGGLQLYDWREDHFHGYRHSPHQPDSLSSNKVRVIFDDNMGDLWVGTFPSGINYFNKSTAFFRNFSLQAEDPDSLSHENVIRFFEDSEQRVWIGTEGGLNEFHPEQNRFTRYVAEHSNPQALQANAVLAITEDEHQALWVGTWGGGLHRFDKDSRVFTHFGSKEPPERYLADDYIWSLLFDSQGRLWVGTENSGLQLYLPDQQHFVQFMSEADDPSSLSFRHVWALLEDSQQRIWVGTIDGLDLLMKVDGSRAQFQHFRHDPADENTLSGNRIISLLEDRRGNLWVGTQDSGLNRLDGKTGRVTRLSVSQGLPSNHISSLLEDNSGYIWITTANGIAMLSPETLDIRTFNESNGLATNHFNRDASYRDPQGKLYFGGAKGFSVVDPNRLSSLTPEPRVVISDFRLFNHSIYANSPNSPLTKPIAQTSAISLSYLQSMISFDFFAVSFRAPYRNQYAYKLEGFDQKWNFVGTQRSATYTNLDPGEYVFQVRAANSDGIWGTQGAAIALTVRGPFWRSPIAYGCYLVLLAALIAFVIYLQKNKLLYLNQKLMAEKLLKLDRLKDAFLANTSHELRTPLNGIIGLAETLQDGAMGEVNEGVKSSLKMISSSGRRLSNLINDILDYSKLNEHQLHIRPSSIALRPLVATVLELLIPLVGKKPIRLINDVPVGTLVIADDDRLQQILLNLVGNAIKFSNSGHVRILTEVEHGYVYVSVEDTGSGIVPRDLQKIFSAFTQLDDDETREQGGTGLGLAITKQLVELHGGSIQVDSQRGIGSTFKFSLPQSELTGASEPEITPSTIRNEVEKLNPIVISDNDDAISLLKPAEQGDQYTILIVDDDAINRMVLSSILAIQRYRVIEVSSGVDALDMLVENTAIDLVIMDVMMPRMSGYEACMRIRVHYPVHTLPILFLTAKNFSDDLVRGFVAGGNDFLTKPVSKHELLSRVSTHLCLLDINRRLEEKYQQVYSENMHNDKELRTLEHIVEIINREMNFKVLLKDLLFDIKQLTEADEIVYWQAEQTEDPQYAVLSGDVDGMKEVCLHNGIEITKRLEAMHNDGQSILILEDLHSSEFQFVADTFPGCISSVLMTIYFENSVVGFITILSFNAQKRFSSEAVSTLERIHAHVTSAVVKAKLLEKLGLNDIMPVS